MSALEEIEAAIKKLTELKAASAQWVTDPDLPELAGWYLDSDGSGRYGVFVLREEFRPGHPVVLYGDRADVDLIVSLHRTIDAQLAILEEAKLQVMSRERLGLPLNTGPVRSHALARAINGAPS